MTVVPLELLPLGFRFHPTDHELVNHYLKRKLNGRIRSEIEVIPEVDVCKWEPWDLPDKAIIRSDDPEWFFFSPKDRKYPNGHRSNRANRATEAGYWKATGKDRMIRTKAPAAPGVIGMKKTLVFHQGRAPKGVRTNWIMHEYRATEPEFESGEGGYVLYRLFWKSEEKIPICNGEETDRSGLSPTPTKSSPSDTQHEADEEFSTPIMATPINQASSLSDIQDDPQSLHPPGLSQPSGITRWLADKADCTSLKSEDGHCNTHMAVEQEAKAGAVMDPLLGDLGPFYDRNDEPICSNGFPTITSPMHPYSNHPFFGSTDQESHMGFYQTDYSERDPMNEFLNSILITQDEYSEESKVQQTSTPEVMHSRLGSEIDNEVGLPQGGVGLQDPGWFNMDTLSDYPDINSALYENISLLPYDSTGPDVYSLDSGADSLQELFNGVQESNCHMNASSNGVGLEETGITGIKIRPRQPQHTTLDNLSAQQGFARRRIRLQCSFQAGRSFQAGALSSSESESSTEEDDNEDVEEIFLVNSVVIEDNEDRETTIKAEENKVHVDIVNEKAVPVCPHIKLEDLHIHDDTNSSSDTEDSCLSDITHESPHIKLEDLSIHDDTNSPSNTEEYCPSNITPESTHNLRLRTRSAIETTVPDNLEKEFTLGPRTSDKLKEESALGPKTSRSDLAMGRVSFLVAMMAILIFLCFGIWRWSRSQILQVSENSI